jgi:subtilisin-like proprotein convertase family protein
VFNPNAFPVSYRIDAELEYSLVGAAIQTFVSTNTPIRLKDDAVIVATNYVPIDRQVVDVQVGVRLEHPRVSDLVLHLVSPQGTRALLVENRGGLTTNGFGSGLLNSYNLVYLTFTENTNLASSLIKFGQPPFTANTTTNTVFSSSFENIAATNYDQNAVVDGWTVVTNSVDVAATPGAHSGKNVLRLNLGRIARTLRTTPGRQYQLTFAYRSEAAGALNGQVILDGAVQALIAATNRWQIHALNFTATANSHLVEITPAVRRTGLVVDSFILAESGGTLYYLPEESLSLFQAERALGNWRLEIWDSRAGATNNPAPTLVSWQLQMVFTVPGQSATVLANGVPVTDTVSGIEIKYFVVNVPPTAIVATNVLIGTGDLVLIGRRSGLPVGDQSVDDYYVDDRGAGAGEYLFISTNWPITAPLQPGQRYYLGVKNANPNETNTFTIWVGFWPPPQPILPTVTALANGLPITRTLTNGPVLDYYQFTVSSNAIATWFELFPSNGDVNLLLRKASQVVNPLPTTSRYDYRSINAGSSPDQILVLTNSLPVPLAPGIWYLGVFNVESFPVTYTIRATELTNVPITVIDLTNGIPRRFSVGTSGTLQDFSRFRITDSNVAARFDLFNLTGNADLVLRRALYPSATNYDAGSFTAGTADEQLIIRTNAGPANLILTDLNGDWYLAVLNRENFPVDGAIRALLTPSFTPLTNAIAITNRIGPGPSWTYYEFTVSSNATMAMFEALPRNGDLALFVRKYQPVPEPWPTLSNFDYFSDQPAANAEQIIVFTNSAPVPLWPGTWYLAVYNDSPAPITYSIVATEYFNAVPPIGILTNGIVVTQTLAVTNALDYFQFTVSSNAIQAVFETFAADGNVNLYVRRGLPLPTPTNFHYLSATPGTNDERVIVHPLSTPVPVSPGTWFLGVSNADTNPVTYSLRATELLMPANYVIRSQLTITNGMIRLTWNSLIGFRYYIEGKTNVADPQWDVISPTITATSTQTVYWIALPTPYHFFQVKQGTPPPPPVQPTIITLANSVPLNASVEAGTQLTNFFLFSITNANYAACFELFNLTGSADLVLRRDQLPSTNNYDFLSAAPSTNAESIGLRTNPGPASLILTNLNGDWYLAVLNQETVPVNFTLLATAMLPPVPLTNAVAVTNSIGPGPAWHYYEFAVSSNATQAAFTAAPTDGNLALFLRQTSPTAQSWLTLNSYDYLSDLSGTNVEQIVVTPDTLPISLAPGIWSLGVFNRDTNSFAYSVVAAELAPPPPILINPYLVRTNNLLGLTWNSLVGTNYYVEGRTNVADRTWDIISPTITATNTLTTYYIALPTPYHFFQIKQGTVPLPPTIVISPQPIITSNSVCLTWTSQVGTNYYVAGRTNVADPQWYPVSPTITATNTVTSYCIPRPTPFHFFQIVQGPAPVPEFGPAILPANLTLTTNGFTLQWTAPSYLQFQVEYSSNLRDWTRFPNPVSSTTGLFTFTDSTVPRGSSVLLRFYRLVLFP